MKSIRKCLTFAKTLWLCLDWLYNTDECLTKGIEIRLYLDNEGHVAPRALAKCIHDFQPSPLS